MTRRPLGRAAAALAVVLLAASAAPVGVDAQSAADSAAIRATALDYVEGWYTGDAARMERALHPDLAKRIVRVDPATGRPRLASMGAADLVEGVRRGGGRETPAARRRSDVHLLDVYHNTASVRADMTEWIDYLHLARWNGRWVIVNVLWELTPEAEAAAKAQAASR
jgi:hypothetical protein